MWTIFLWVKYTVWQFAAFFFFKLSVWSKKLYKVEISNSTYCGFNCLHKSWWQLSHWCELLLVKLHCFWKSCWSLNICLLNSARVCFQFPWIHWFLFDKKHWSRFSYVADSLLMYMKILFISLVQITLEQEHCHAVMVWESLKSIGEALMEIGF